MKSMVVAVLSLNSTEKCVGDPDADWTVILFAVVDPTMNTSPLLTRIVPPAKSVGR